VTNGYVINVGNASAKQWITFGFEKTLNAMSNAEIGLDGVSTAYSTDFDTDKEIYIYKNGTLKFRGIVVDKNDLTGGGVVLTAQGIEIQLADQKAPMVGSAISRVWNATSDHTIFDTLVTSVSGWTVDTSNSTPVSPASFRVSATESVWNSAIRLIEQTGKDVRVDQANKKLYLYDSLTVASQFSFIEGKNAKEISRKKSRSKAGKVVVYGKGDGVNQIIGSTGSSNPVVVIIDRNILSVTEANARAVIEYDKLNPNPLEYNLTPLIVVDDLDIGDSGKISNNSAGINETVDIVRMKTVVDGNGTEKVTMQVTNPDYRLASKNGAESAAKQLANYLQSQTSMQGSGNTLTWGNSLNGKLNYPLPIVFQIPASFITDEAGHIRVNSFTVDYDVDPYKKGVGIAAYAGSDPQVQNSSANTQPAVTGSTDMDSDHGTWDYVDGGIGFLVSRSTFGLLYNAGYITGALTFFTFTPCHPATAWTTITLRVKDATTTTYYPSSTGITCTLSATGDFAAVGIVITDFLGYNNLQVQYKADDDIDCYVMLQSIGQHDHASGSLAAANHLHTDGSYDILASDINNITIGDDVSDAAGVNSAQVSLYLDFWNGSAWVNKHSILNTGKTLDTDVDISNSGTYPDAAGYWRVRVNPSSATADFVQGIVKIKHLLDS
jgi:hypothetical protein